MTNFINYVVKHISSILSAQKNIHEVLFVFYFIINNL